MSVFFELVDFQLHLFWFPRNYKEDFHFTLGFWILEIGERIVPWDMMAWFQIMKVFKCYVQCLDLLYMLLFLQKYSGFIK